MAKKYGCKDGVMIGKTCVRQNDFIMPKKQIKNVTKVQWGEYEMKWDYLPKTPYHVNIISSKNDLILAFADPDHRPIFISSKHIYKVPLSKLRKVGVKKL